MPSPFNKETSTGPQHPVEVVAVEDSVLVCEYCFHESDSGRYIPGSKQLIWDCTGCNQLNIVKDIDL